MIYEKTLRFLLSTALLLVLAGCGGGGGGGSDVFNGDGGEVDTSPQLSNATSLLDYIDNYARVDEPTKARWRTYNSNFDDFPDLIMFANGMMPIEANSEYTQWKRSVYPTPNGDIHFLDEVDDDIFGYEGIDLNNGLIGTRKSRVYWGVKNIDYELDPRGFVEFLILIEVIVDLDSVPQYRSTIVWEGLMCHVGDCDLAPPDSPVDFPGEWLRGQYAQTVDEVLLPDPQSYPTGVLLKYDAFWQRLDKPTGYPEG